MRKVPFALIVLAIIGSCGRNSIDRSAPYVAEYCKVWGFLKYYHPSVVEGQINWDSVFLSEYPKASEAQNTQELSVVINDLLGSVGGVRSFGWTLIDTTGLQRQVRSSWKTDEQLLSSSIVNSLDSVWSNEIPMYTRFVSPKEAGNADFSADTADVSNPRPNEAQRVLALAKYWNAIEYFAPYKNIIGENWDSVLLRYIPRVIQAESAKAFNLIMLECCCGIHDSHSYTTSATLDSLFGDQGLPLELSCIENKIIVTKTFAGAGNLKPGDEIISIGSDSVTTLRRHFADMVPASNIAARERNICWQILHGNRNKTASIFYRRLNTTNHCDVPYYPSRELEAQREIDSGLHYRILEGSIGYVNMGKLTISEVDGTIQLLLKTKAIIFDLRNYPDETEYLVSKYLPIRYPWVSFSIPNWSAPGTFRMEGLDSAQHTSEGRYQGRVIILVNEETQSHAEFTAMLLRASKGSTVIGSQTAGADGNISVIHLPGGIRTVFSGIGVFYPDGKPTQRVGIVPDIVVTPTVQGIAAGRDEVLLAALKFVRDQKK